jgi:hypothetical protein
MIIYRVQNLEWLVTQLDNEGVKILDEIETHEYGSFVGITRAYTLTSFAICLLA